MDVEAVVPARNESARIAETVGALRSLPEIRGVIVVDDGSSDGTGDLANAAGATVVTLPRDRGKGGALREGIMRTTAPVLVFVDGDLGSSAVVARGLLEPVMAGEADMTIAAPPPAGPSGFGLVENLARAGIRALTGRTFARPLSGQRALRRTVVQAVRIAPRFGVETALTIDALRAGFRVTEIPLSFEHAKTVRNAAGFAHRARQGADVAFALASRLRRRPAGP